MKIKALPLYHQAVAIEPAPAEKTWAAPNEAISTAGAIPALIT